MTGIVDRSRVAVDFRCGPPARARPFGAGAAVLSALLVGGTVTAVPAAAAVGSICYSDLPWHRLPEPGRRPAHRLLTRRDYASLWLRRMSTPAGPPSTVTCVATGA